MDDGTVPGGSDVKISESAARRLSFLMAQENRRDLMLRIAVSGGGCSGFQYGFTLDDERQPEDVVFQRDGATVVVDSVSLDLLRGAEVDFIEDLSGSSFQIRNPNATSSCGCGNSFSI